MRVRAGDLAVVVNNRVNAGVIVRVLHRSRFVGWWDVEALSGAHRIEKGVAPQRIPPGTICCAPDNELRSLRDDPGQDETLTWRGKCSKWAIVNREKQ